MWNERNNDNDFALALFLPYVVVEEIFTQSGLLIVGKQLLPRMKIFSKGVKKGGGFNSTRFGQITATGIISSGLIE